MLTGSLTGSLRLAPAASRTLGRQQQGPLAHAQAATGCSQAEPLMVMVASCHHACSCLLPAAQLQ